MAHSEVANKLVEMVRRLLGDVAPADLAQYESDLAAVRMESGGTKRDVALRWAGHAVLRADPLTADELDALQRFRDGGSHGLRILGDDGVWRTV